MPAETKPPDDPIVRLARELNPRAGALAESLPFQLRAETINPHRRPDEQRGLFEEDDQP